MKFMVTWEVHPDKRADVLHAWASLTPEERADVGEGVTMIGRWHNNAEYTGVAILETEDVSALYRYLGRWNTVMDMDVAAVLDDEESAALAQSVLNDLAR